MNADDIYVMPAFVTLAVRNVPESAQWYRDVLGFFILFEIPGQLVHLRREKYQDVLLKPAASLTGPKPGTPHPLIHFSLPRCPTPPVRLEMVPARTTQGPCKA